MGLVKVLTGGQGHIDRLAADSSNFLCKPKSFMFSFIASHLLEEKAYISYRLFQSVQEKPIINGYTTRDTFTGFVTRCCQIETIPTQPIPVCSLHRPFKTKTLNKHKTRYGYGLLKTLGKETFIYT